MSARDYPSLRKLYEAFDPKKAALQFPGFAEAVTEGGKFKPGRVAVSIETGQLGGFFPDAENGGRNSLLQVATFCGGAGADSIIPSCYLLQDPAMGKDPKQIKFRSRIELEQIENATGVRMGPPSAHCITWSMGAVLLPDGPQLVSAFVPAAILAEGARYASEWCRDYSVELARHSAARGIKVVPCFLPPAGNAFLAAVKYPWPFGMDKLYLAAIDEFAALFAPLSAVAKELGGLVWAHEIHDGTMVQSAMDLVKLLVGLDYDPSIGVWLDPSHTDEGEDWFDRTSHAAVAARGVGGHIKNYSEYRGPKRLDEEDWAYRAKRFCSHGAGRVNLEEYIRLVFSLGVAQRYAFLAGTIKDGYCFLDAASEAEDWAAALLTKEEVEATLKAAAAKPREFPKLVYRGASAKGIQWVREHLLLTQAQGLFTDTMGAA